MAYTLRTLCFITFLSLCTSPIDASDVIKILPVTNEIVMVHFVDGFIQHHDYGQWPEDDETINDPLDINLAMLANTYQISSSNDDNYLIAQQPIEIYRKSKGIDFSRDCQWNGAQCINDIVFEHRLFLRLPFAMQNGKTYTITFGELAYNIKEISLNYHDQQSRSEIVHVNQLGYAPQATKKYAYLSYWMGDGGALDLSTFEENEFHIVNEITGTVEYTGYLNFRTDQFHQETAFLNETPNGNFQAADTYEADFSDFNQTGEYRLCVDGIGCSYPFEIGVDVYREAFYHTSRGLFFERSGIAKEPPFAEHSHPIDHHPQINETTILYTTSRFIDQNDEIGDESTVMANVTGELENLYGWYHDAGDWDGYPSHTKVPKALMLTFELASDRFFDGELNIPESGNGLPDILDEAFWLINYFRRNTGPTGGKFGARIHADFEGYPEGSIPSWEDPRTWIAFGEDPWINFEFAGLAAQMAWCLQLTGQPIHEELITALTVEAIDAYNWAVNNMQDGDLEKVRDAQLYGSAQLFRLTQNMLYQDDFLAISNLAQTTDSDFFRTYRWGYWTYALVPNNTPSLNIPAHNTIISGAVAHADFEDRFAYDSKHSYRYYGNFWQPMLVGQPTTPFGMASMVAHHLTDENKYLEGLYTTADYFLGGNQLNQVWITGLGDQYPKQIVHIDSWYDQQEGMISGIVPYGPTKSGDIFNGNWYDGPHDADYNRELAVYPMHTLWPGHELWFENRHTIISNEFTIHQNNNFAAAVYGYLSDPAHTFVPNQRPTGTITSLTENQTLGVASHLLEIDAEDLDGRVDRVEYYFDWHKIGETTTPPFDYLWTDKPDGEFSIQAIIYDNKGLSAKSNPINITIDNTSNIVVANEVAQIKITPNPTQGQIQIYHSSSLKVDQALVLNPDGRIIKSFNIKRNTTLDISDLSNGVYFLQLGGIVKRIVKL